MSTAPDVKGQYSPKRDPHIPSYLFGTLSKILTEGTNVTITPDPSNETITIDSTGGGGGATYTEGSGIDITTNVISFDTAFGDARYALSSSLSSYLLSSTAAATYAPTTSIREKLTANRTYYIRNDGNDSNNGLANTSGGAKLTFAGALAVAKQIDLNGFKLTIKLATNLTIIGPIDIPVLVGQGVIDDFIIEGDTTTPSNATITATGVPFVFKASAGGRCLIQGIKIAGDSGCDHFWATAGGAIWANANDHGTGKYHWLADNNGVIVHVGGYTVSGSANVHWFAQTGGRIVSYFTFTTITISGTPAFAYSFAMCLVTSSIFAYFVTFSGAATGARFIVDDFSVIDTAGSGSTFFPGDVASSAGANGIYK